jgi:hypothetical protein
MTVYVLTQTEGKTTIPVATVTAERVAEDWFKLKPNNDFFPLEMDRTEHLGLAPNGPTFVDRPTVAAPVKRFVLPVVPAITRDMTPVNASKALATYLAKLSESMETIQHALDSH